MRARPRDVLLSVLVALTMGIGVAGAQSRDPEHYQLLLRDSAGIKTRGHVQGSIGVNRAGGKLNLSHSVIVSDGRDVVADRVIVGNGAHAFNVFTNILHMGAGGTIGGTTTEPVPAPVYSPEPLIVPD